MTAEPRESYSEEAQKKKQQSAQWNQKLKELRKAKASKDDIDHAKEKEKALAKEARAAENKAQEIEDAVYDLKAVNPNRKPVIDTRTPEEILDVIEEKGKEIAEAIAVLRSI